MAVNVRDAQGNIVSVSEEEASRLAQAGAVAPVGKELLVQHETFGQRWVKPAELQEALGMGFRVTGDAQSSTVRQQERFGGETAEATLDAVARGATFGWSDKMLRDAGMPAEDIRGRAEANPAAALLGEMAGGVLPFLPTALAGGVLHGARTAVTPFQALGRAMSREALVGAAEGTLFGAGQAVSDAAMDRDPLTVQKALAGAGMGALFGAGLGALGGAAGEVGQRVLGRAARAADDLPTAPGPEPLPGPGPAARVEAPATEVPGGRAPPAPAAPPPSAPPPPKTPGGILDSILETALATALPVKSAIERNPGLITRALDAMGIPLNADEAVWRGLTQKQKWVMKLDYKGLKEVAPQILRADRRFRNVRKLEDAIELIGTKSDEMGADYVARLKELDALATPATRLNLAEIADRLEKDLLPQYKKGPAAYQGMHGITSKIEAEIRRFRRLAEEEGLVPLERGEQLKREFDPLAEFHRTSPPLEKSAAAMYQDLRRIIKRSVEDKADALSKSAGTDLVGAWKDAKKGYGAMESLLEVAKDTANSRLGNRFFSLTDNLAGVAAGIAGGGLNPLGLGLALAGAMLNKWNREQLPWVFARALNRAEKPGIKAAAEGLGRAVRAMPPSDVNAVENAFRRPVTARELAGEAALPVPQAGAAAPAPISRAGAPMEPSPALVQELSALPRAPLAPAMRQEVGRALIGFLRRAAEQGTVELWATHEALSASEEYREELERRGWAGLVLPEDEQEADAQGKAAAEALEARQRALDAEGRARAGVLLATQRQAEKLDRRVAIAARAALAGGGRPKPRPQASDAVVKKLATMAENPEAFQAAVAKALGAWPAAAPGAATEAAMAMTRAVRHLAPLAPRQQRGPLAAIPALRQPWIANSLQAETFRAALAAATDPASVLDDLAAGRVSAAGLEAVQAIYPELLADFRARVVDELTLRQDRLSYNQQVQLSLLLGEPLHESLEPATLAALQAIHEPAQPQPRPRPAPVRGPPLTTGLTPAQRLTSKGA